MMDMSKSFYEWFYHDSRVQFWLIKICKVCTSSLRYFTCLLQFTCIIQKFYQNIWNISLSILFKIAPSCVNLEMFRTKFWKFNIKVSTINILLFNLCKLTFFQLIIWWILNIVSTVAGIKVIAELAVIITLFCCIHSGCRRAWLCNVNRCIGPFIIRSDCFFLSKSGIKKLSSYYITYGRWGWG